MRRSGKTPIGALLNVYSWGRSFNIIDIDRISLSMSEGIWPQPAASELGRLADPLVTLAVWRRPRSPWATISYFDGLTGLLYAPSETTEYLLAMMLSAEDGDARWVSPVADVAERLATSLMTGPRKGRHERAVEAVDRFASEVMAMPFPLVAVV